MLIVYQYLVIVDTRGMALKLIPIHLLSDTSLIKRANKNISTRAFQLVRVLFIIRTFYRVKSSFTVLPKYFESFSASSVLGINLLFSIANIVWRLTPMDSASSFWDMCFIARSTLILFSIF